jgi:hypothetical protein
VFRPFDLGRWFVIGFCAWLAGLGENGFNFQTPHGSSRHGGSPDLQHDFQQVRDYIAHNLYWIVPLAAVVLIVVLGLGILMLWLNSRGKFMFLHCVALNKAEVTEPWHKYASLAHSLFIFRLVLALIGLVISLPTIGLIGVLIYGIVSSHEWTFAGTVFLAALVMTWLLMAIAFALIGKFTRDFVVPIMFLRGKRCVESWGIFRDLLVENVWQFVLYLLFQIVIGIAISLLILTAVLVTLCIAGCLLAIPYVGTVLLLPVLVFQRTYSLHYLALYGSEFNVFPPPGYPAPPSTPPSTPA